MLPASVEEERDIAARRTSASPSQILMMPHQTQQTSLQQSVQVCNLKELDCLFDQFRVVCTVLRPCPGIRHHERFQIQDCNLNRCLKWASLDHAYTNCRLSQLSSSLTGSCFTCCIRLPQKQDILAVFEFGTKRGRLIIGLGLLFNAWEEETDLHRMLQTSFLPLRLLQSAEDFVFWLHLTGIERNLNNESVLPIFVETCVNND